MSDISNKVEKLLHDMKETSEEIKKRIQTLSAKQIRR